MKLLPLVAVLAVCLREGACLAGAKQRPADNAPGKAEAHKPRPITTVVNDMLFDLELALTPKARERGLMFRKHLKPEQGMLFVFPDNTERRFWMKNTLIDLDIVYLDASGHVVRMLSMRAEPLRGEHETEEQYEERLKLYPSKAPARFALEFRGGTLALLGLKVGDLVPLPVNELLAKARP